jgi:hypothetical protein
MHCSQMVVHIPTVMLGLLLSSTPSTPGACSCSKTETVRVTTVTAFSFIQAYYLPRLTTILPSALPVEPFRYGVTVDKSGLICDLQTLSTPEARVNASIVGTLRKWRFRAPIYRDHQMCMQTKVLVYVRRTSAGVQVFVPGLVDANAK